jgi:hypothetical protein
MRRTTSQAKERIAIKFDADVDFEAMLLAQLDELPELRREEWLRGLLMKGFQRELRERQRLLGGSPRRVVAPPPPAVEVRTTGHRAVTGADSAAAQDDVAAPGNRRTGTVVSLAALRKVIGQDWQTGATADDAALDTPMEIAQ